MSKLRFWSVCAVSLALLLAAIVFALAQWNLRHFSAQVGDRLQLLGELRRGALQQYYATAEAELRFWSTNDELRSLQQQLNALWEEGSGQRVQHLYVAQNPNPPGYYLNLDDANDGSQYSRLHALMHPRTRQFVTHRGYYDFFLISPSGDIYYTVEKESDFATNLLSGPWQDSGLASVFVRAREAQASKLVVVSDMEAYGPSQQAPAIFMATALHSPQGQFLGVLAFQLPTDRILGIMAYTEGMGQTGETYLVGADKLMRSDSRFSAQSTVLSQSVDTAAVRAALAGEEGVAVIDDYRSVPVLSAYMPVKLGGETWAVLAEIDVAEIEAAAALDRPGMAGALVIIYGLSLWTIWYWRGRRMPEVGEGMQMADIEFGEDGGGAG